MKFVFAVIAAILLSASYFAQDPLPVVRSSWHPATEKADKAPTPQTGPAKQIITDDTVGARTSRDFRTDHPDNPSDQTPDGRRAVIERNEQEANTAQPGDVRGFDYTATVRNDSSKVVQIIYWEYKFQDRTDPSNVVRRQFLCSVNLKKGAEQELSVFSTLGPTNTVSAIAVDPGAKLFNESVRINRIEYADDDILQRGDWKLADVKAALERATAKPWGNEMCRPLVVD